MRIYSDTEYMRNDMSATVQQSGELLYGGPPHKLQRSLGLIKPGDPMIARPSLSYWSAGFRSWRWPSRKASS
jgi:hypothetical protein